MSENSISTTLHADGIEIESIANDLVCLVTVHRLSTVMVTAVSTLHHKFNIDTLWSHNILTEEAMNSFRHNLSRTWVSFEVDDFCGDTDVLLEVISKHVEE